MAGNPSARPSAAWLGDGLRGDVRTAGHPAKTAHGIWFSGPRQAEDSRKGKAS
jgi:hypothetical protein